MAKYLSNRQQNLKIGISSYTDNLQVLEVTGNVGIKTSNTQNYELYVAGDANISGIVSATEFYGSGINLTDLIQTINISKIEGIGIQNNGGVIGTSATTINFGSGLSAVYSSGIATVISTNSGVQVLFGNINTGTASTILNFKGTGISSVTSNSGISTITVDLQGNLDGGTPTSNYGGIESIEGGGI